MAKKKRQVTKLEATVEPPRLGVVSQLFGGTPEQVADLIDEYQLETVLLVPSFSGLRFASAADVTPALCQQMSRPFAARGLDVAAVSAYTNLVDPEPQRCARNADRFLAIVDHCQEFGTTYVITGSGTLNPEHPLEDCPENHTQEARDALATALEPCVARAEKAGATILLAGYLYHIVDSIDVALQFRARFGEHLGFLLDPPNYFTRGMATASKRPLEKFVRQMAPCSPIAIAKDVRYAGGLSTPRASTGTLDYHTYLTELGKHLPGCPLILEQLRPEQLAETIDFIDGFFPE